LTFLFPITTFIIFHIAGKFGGDKVKTHLRRYFERRAVQSVGLNTKENSA